MMLHDVRQPQGEQPAGLSQAANDEQAPPLLMGRSVFPDDAVACIYQPTRSPTTAGRARTKGWRLRFEPRSASYIEPLMGWTGSDDTLKQVELTFPTLEAALRYAERQGLAYEVMGTTDRMRPKEAQDHTRLDVQLPAKHVPEDAANDLSGVQAWAVPMKIVANPILPPDAKHAILLSSAWTQYLMDQTAHEGVRLDEIERALCTLADQATARWDGANARMAA